MFKVMESIIYDHIIDFIRPKLSPSQFGFLPKRSSITQLLSCYNGVINGFEAGNATDIIYLDLRKAFDSVPHEELLFKLWHLGITGPLWRWFQAYLQHRQHFVEYEGFASTKMPVIPNLHK